MAPKKAYYDELNHKNQKLLKKHEKEIVSAYVSAFEDAYEELIIATMDDDKYNKKAYFKARMAYVNQLYEKLSELEAKYNVKTSEHYKACVKDFFDMEKEFKNDTKYQELKEAISKKVDITNEKVINLIKSGKMYEADKNGNFVDLDNRLWNAANASGKKLQDAIVSCFAQGMGPADMARVLKEFAKEGHKTWSSKKIREKLGPGYARSHSGGLDYPALRLARTVHTHTNQLRVIHGKDTNPYMNMIKYHSAHIANRTCSMCEERDGKIFTPNKVPLDHPNGLCWLEPVFSLSDDEIADDLAKWIRGEPNSGVMDKAYPELKGTENYKPKEKEKPEKEKPEKEKPEKEKPKKEPAKKKQKEPAKKEYKEVKNQSIEDYKQHFKKLADQNNMGAKQRKEAHEYIDEAVEVLEKYFPQDIKDAYYLITKEIKEWTQDNRGAYWQMSTKKVQFSINKHMKDKAKKFRIGKFDTWFHENGHAMDALLGTKYELAQGKYMGKRTLSSQKPYINALKKDFEEQKINLRRKYLKEKGEKNADKMSEQELKKAIPDKDLNRLYNYYLRGKHKTCGIQDVIEGMSNCEISVQWGHGKEYWNRRNREDEYASEAWANMLGSYSDPETYAFMKEYFPNALKMQETLIKRAMKEVTNKK